MDAENDDDFSDPRFTPIFSPSSIVTNGAVSGKLSDAEAFAVHYPGYPSTLSLAIQTLGGLHTISMVRSSTTSSLELRFRPEDPYCHPMLGEPRACSALLLRISKRKSANCSDEAKSLSAVVIARVFQSYHFEGIADYQHVVSVCAGETRRKKRHLLSDSESPSEKGCLLGWDNVTDVMMIVPPLFSHKRTLQNVVLHPPANLFSRSIQHGLVEHRWEMEIEPCLALDFKVEKIPPKFDWESNVVKDSIEWEWQAAVARLFDKQPIWPRWSLHEHLVDDGLQVPENYLKRLLLRTGYYFNAGPFRQFCIRKGYDPRVDPESRIYQRVEFRAPFPIKNSSNEGKDCEVKQSWRDFCRFRVFPSKKNNYFQLLELDDDFIQEEIKKTPRNTACDSRTGWFSAATHKALIFRVKIRFLSLCTEKAAEDLLKSVRSAFIKAKKEATREEVVERKQISNKDHDASEGADGWKSSSVDMDSVVVEQPHEDCSNNFNLDDDDDEEEEEEDEDEPLNVEDKDDYFSIDPGSLVEVSGGLLEEFISELPFVKDDAQNYGELQCGNSVTSDSEYEIYEQEDEDEYEDGVEDDGRY